KGGHDGDGRRSTAGPQRLGERRRGRRLPQPLRSGLPAVHRADQPRQQQRSRRRRGRPGRRHGHGQARDGRRRVAGLCDPGPGCVRPAREVHASLSAVTTALPPEQVAEPARAPRRMSTRRLLSINAMWLGQGAHWPPISFQLVPVAAIMIAGGSADLLIGRVSAAGNVFALIAPVLAGWLSDRTSTRWGKRRPWIVAGTAVNLAGIGLLAAAGSPLTLAFAYMLVQLAFNLAGGAYAAVIPDVVPATDRGRASGLLGMMNALGAVIGLAAVTAALAVFHETRLGLVVGYTAIAVVLLITTAVSVIAIEEPARPSVPHGALRLEPGVILAGVAAFVALAAWLTL